MATAKKKTAPPVAKKTAAPAKKASAPAAKKAPTAKKAAPPSAPAGKRVDVGDRAPNVKLPDESGGTFDLASAKGKIVVLYFYPKADTSGCTAESIAFRDAKPAFAKAGAIIVGLSPDAVTAQKKFQTKYSLPFPLLADVEHQAALAYGVWQEKSMYGRTYFGIERSTFVVDREGKLAAVFRKVKVPGHADEVLAAVKAVG